MEIRNKNDDGKKLMVSDVEQGETFVLCHLVTRNLRDVLMMRIYNVEDTQLKRADIKAVRLDTGGTFHFAANTMVREVGAHVIRED